MGLTCAENMRRYRARIAGDSIRRAQYLAKHRLWRQSKASTKCDTRPGYRKEAAIQLKNETNVKFLDLYKQNEKLLDLSSLNTEIAEIFYDKSIPEDVKAELYWIVLRRYNNAMSDEDNVEANPVEVALPPPIPPPASPSPQPLESAEWKRCCHKRRASPSSTPLVLAAAESGYQRRRQKSPPSSLPRQSKHDRRKSIVWEALL